MSNKIALITGGSRGIGRATALTLAKDGYDICINYISNDSKALEVQSEILALGRTAYLLKGDISSENDVKAIFEKFTEISDKLDLLVNNAGIDHALMIEDYTIDQMREVVDVVLIGKMIMTKYALPYLKKSESPKIINVASRMGREKTIETIGAYGPAEAGVIKFTQCCALEFAKYNIKVNCVAPGLTRTDLTNDILVKEEGSQEKADEIWELLASKNPSHRVGQPQDTANVVSFLASDKADYINGEYIGINGGSNLG
jgi:3-oxoacyl-[acyl-carrier protein] reductase